MSSETLPSQEEEPKNARASVLRGAGIMTLMTALSRVLGLVREQVRSFLLGTGMASDAFGIASIIPNLFRRLLAEGAMTAAFVPVFAEYRKEKTKEEMSLFLSRFMTLFTFLVTAVMLLGMWMTPWIIRTCFPGFEQVDGKIELTIFLTWVMWPYLLFVSLAAIIQAILNSFRVFAPSAFTPVLLNLTIIGTAALFSTSFENPSFAFAWGFVLGGIFQLLFQLPFLRGHGVRIRPAFSFGPGVKKVAIIFLPGVFAAGIYQINVLVAQFIASTLAEGAVSSLQFSLRLQELVLGLFAISVSTVILPVMSDQVVEKDHEGLKDTLRFSTAIIAFVTIPASIGLFLLAVPIVRLLFEFGEFDSTSTQLTAFALYFHAVGIFVIAWNRIVTQVFYAMRDLKTPTLVAAGIMILHAALCVVLSGPLAHGGIALAGGIAAAVNVAILWWLLRRQIGSLGSGTLMKSLSKVVLSSTIMGCILYIGIRWTGIEEITQRLHLGLTLVGLVALSLAAFIATAVALKSKELKEVWQLIRRRKFPTP
jgi:putative peptidoglycan lipid II flippase